RRAILIAYSPNLLYHLRRNQTSRSRVGFRDSKKVELVFFSFAQSPCGILPCPNLSANDVFQAGHRNMYPQNLMLRAAGEEFLIARVRAELHAQFASGPLSINGVFELLNSKPAYFELALNLWQSFRHDDNIDIYGVNRLNVAVHRQPPDQTPWSDSIQGRDQIRKIGRAAIRD